MSYTSRKWEDFKKQYNGYVEVTDDGASVDAAEAKITKINTAFAFFIVLPNDGGTGLQTVTVEVPTDLAITDYYPSVRLDSTNEASDECGYIENVQFLEMTPKKGGADTPHLLVSRHRSSSDSACGEAKLRVNFYPLVNREVESKESKL